MKTFLETLFPATPLVPQPSLELAQARALVKAKLARLREQNAKK